MAFTRGWCLFWSKCQWCGAYVRPGTYSRKYSISQKQKKSFVVLLKSSVSCFLLESLYPLGTKSGLKKPKEDKYQHYPKLPLPLISLDRSVSTSPIVHF